MWITYLVTPIVGGIIGYVTNDIAIKMLFRPHEAKYIFGHKIPFTPGIIPKEKTRIAKALGDAISQNLMNREVLERTLLSDEIQEKIPRTIDKFVENQKDNPESLRSFLTHYLTEEEIKQIADNVSTELEGMIVQKLSASDFGHKIASMTIQHAVDKTANSLLGLFGADKIMKPIVSIAEPLLAKEINSMIQNNSSEMVHNLVHDQTKDLLRLHMCEIFQDHDEQIEQFKTTVVSIYRTLILERLPRVLHALNISQIVEQRINEMDMKEIEPLIFDIMDKELKAIVWLGAGLGTIIGCVNRFI